MPRCVSLADPLPLLFGVAPGRTDETALSLSHASQLCDALTVFCGLNLRSVHMASIQHLSRLLVTLGSPDVGSVACFSGSWQVALARKDTPLLSLVCVYVCPCWLPEISR